MIPASHSFSNGRLHQSRQRRQHVDWRVDLSIVKLPVHIDLSLGDVASQVRDGMGDIWEEEEEVGGLDELPFITSSPSLGMDKIGI